MLEDIIQDRLKKKRAYPARVERTHLVSEVLNKFADLEKSGVKIAITGRIIGLRVQGGIIFIDVQDESGKMQAVIQKETVANFDEFRDNSDIGDFTEVVGKAFVTKAGQQSILAVSVRNIAKAIRPLPSVWHGLHDIEERFRKRYLDLILNKDVKEKINKRSEIIAQLRKFLWKQGFVEMETPMLQPIPGGAKARPFITHHNALDPDFYLRIAPELYLKRLLVGGFEKIFELGRVFRNEGIDRDHNPEFTELELYWAYQDYNGLMKFVQKMLKPFIAGKIQKVKFAKVFKEHSGKDWLKTEGDLDEIFKKEVRPKIVEPTFVIDYPEKLMSLAKLNEKDPTLTESFQLIVNGVELVKGFSELNDPVFQREQMERQEQEFRAGNPEASRLDEDYLEALEHGMPPAAGLGIGIDRLVQFVTGAHAVKEIIAFPTLRPKTEER